MDPYFGSSRYREPHHDESLRQYLTRREIFGVHPSREFRPMRFEPVLEFPSMRPIHPVDYVFGVPVRRGFVPTRAMLQRRRQLIEQHARYYRQDARWRGRSITPEAAVQMATTYVNRHPGQWLPHNQFIG